MERYIGILGCFVLLAIAWLLSNRKRQIDYRIVVWGLLLQFVIAIIILKTSLGQVVFLSVNTAISKFLSFADAGLSLLFGDIFHKPSEMAQGLPDSSPSQIWNAENSQFVNVGITFAFHVLPTIVFFASLMSVLYHLGIMQRVIKGIARVMSTFMGTSGAESLSVTANIFVGQIEGPLTVKPFISGMTMSELMTLMTGGFATVAASFMTLYMRWGIEAKHLLAASVMSAPAALVMAKILFPETQVPQTTGKISVNLETDTANMLEAAARGAADGLRLALNVGAMLFVFMGLIAMVDFSLLKLGLLFGMEGLSLAKILGYAFSPLALVMGIETGDVLSFGYLLGTKISINELVAYQQLVQWQEVLSERTVVIATYALCGFANFSAIAMQIGGIGGMAPDRKHDLAKLGLKAMIGGALASWLTASIAGVLI